ncbi:MAG: hypothetical protein R2699_12550 [Acidimicrobiales bacterium]
MARTLGAPPGPLTRADAGRAPCAATVRRLLPMSSAAPAVVVVPVKAFERAKLRLAPALTAPERRCWPATWRRRSWRRRSLCESSWSATIPTCGPGPRRSASTCAGHPGWGWTAPSPPGSPPPAPPGPPPPRSAADLPYARDLAAVVAEVPVGQVGLVPDRHEDGTNVAIVPTGAGFTFAYGPGSFGRHRAEAERLGLPVTVLRPVHLGWDVDEPGDLTSPDWAGAGVLATAGIEPTSAPSADAPRRSEPT